MLDTAQTVNVVPQYVMQEQAATELRDTLRNVPGISLAAGEGGSQGDTLTIRGFNARNDIFLDGIRDFGSYYRDAFDFQAVEVLQGPAGIEFGRGSTGGVVNQESKEPELRKFVHANAQFGTDEMRRVSADINQPLTGLPDGAAFRLNVVGSQNMFAGRQISEVRRFGIAPALSFGLNTPTRYIFEYLHESENTTPDYGLPYFGAAVAPVDHSNYYGFASENYLRTNPDILTGKVEHDFSSRVSARNILRWANYPRDVRITEPQINTAGTLSYVNSDSMNKYEGPSTTFQELCNPATPEYGNDLGLLSDHDAHVHGPGEPQPARLAQHGRHALGPGGPFGAFQRAARSERCAHHRGRRPRAFRSGPQCV